MPKFKETIVISLGGSLVCPGELDADFLKQFKNIILNQLQENLRLVLITGGGKICRKYNEVAKDLNPHISSNDLDVMGIRATKLNAELVRLMFNELSYFKVIDDPDEKVADDKPIIVAGGWKPGASSDNMAVNLAKTHQAKKLINLTNIDHVYDNDPNKFSDAKPLKNISWVEFRQIVGDKWDPGLNAPFDPIASQLAEKLQLEVVILNGKKLENLNNYLINQEFFGTIIKF